MSEISKLRQTTDYVATQAEREAQQRIQRANEEIRKSERESERRLSQIDEDYAVQVEKELLRNEAALQKQQAQGYEQIRKVQHQQNQQVGEVARDGQRKETDLTRHYRKRTYELERDGSKKVRDLQSKTALQVEFEQGRNRRTMDQVRSDNAERLSRLKESSDAKMQEESAITAKQLEGLSDKHAKSLEMAQAKFNTDLKNTIAKQHELLQEVNERGAREFKRLQEDTVLRLGAYDDRQSDPFYRLVNLDADLEDYGSHYILTATIPPHEQGNVSVNIKGDSMVVLTGSRQTQERQESEPGRIQSTSAYQSYTESIPLDWPVDPRGIVRQYDGDQLVIRIPKKGPYVKDAPYQGKRHNKPIQMERPNFPAKLPLPDGVGTADEEKLRATRDHRITARTEMTEGSDGDS